ncbi:helix-turn-helix domain-containing protein [Streptomyces daliensis]
MDAAGLFARVRFRRRAPAAPLLSCVEHYWLIDWDLDEPYVSYVVPHPSVNVVFEDRGGARGPEAQVAGVGTGLFSTKLEGRGRVCGIRFRPGGFRPFLTPTPTSTPTSAHTQTSTHTPASPPALSALTGRNPPLAEVFPHVSPDVPSRVLAPEDEDARVAALDAFLLALGPRPEPGSERARRLVERVRGDRSVLRVEEFARSEGMTVRGMQRLFAEHVGVSPKWVILRYRLHEALERASAGPGAGWARLAAELGYSDQAHLVRDFTATVGVTPAAYARTAAASRAASRGRGPGQG